MNEKRFKDYKTNDEIHEISEVIGIWAAYVGYNIQANELIVINQFIRKSFPLCNIQDLKEIVDMVGNNTIKTDYHGNLTVLYVGKVFAEYRVIRSAIISDVKSKLNSVKIALPLPKPTQDEQLENLKNLFTIAFTEAKTGIYFDGGYCLYDFLVEKKLIVFTPEIKKDAARYAIREIRKSEAEKNKNIGLKERAKKTQKTDALSKSSIKRIPLKSKEDLASETIMYKKQFVVNKWLKSKTETEITEFLTNLTL